MQQVVIGVLLKLLLFPAYHSTDFDVHRNWLAITSKLPISEWYFEDTSEWTLDYPPFFAYFEWILSKFVPKVVENDGCLDIVAHGNYGWPTVVFQRTTVLVSELVLAASLIYFTRSKAPLSYRQKMTAAAIIWFSPGWLILDHIHFQYNAMMFGLLVISITAVANGQMLVCAFTFASLLCFKHIYLYLAPAYFAFLLRAYIFENNKLSWLNGVKLAAVVVAPALASFGPFVLQLPQVLSRLFPFSRGLTHAYWAPNFWALYTFAERVLGVVRHNSSAAATRGIVGQIEFVNLADITPRITAVLTLFYQVLSVIPLFLKPTYDQFLGSLTLCGFASFLFGWHVHEKAIMIVIVPFAFMAVSSRSYALAFSPLLVAGHLSLMPLIFTPNEAVIKYVYTAVYLTVVLSVLPEIAPVKDQANRRFFAERYVFMYNALFVLLIPALAILPVIAKKFEFANLMLLSVYCALGVMGSWLALNTVYFSTDLLSK
ncbi:Dolichyl pyrophosphate Glc1Man9GlcNAc2 alpha-1,3-glucosyltransferase [Wickerhamiella sorbophila]|uniref:Alpha-1,3-glucosyltransferase n=1 Tax=Wickerhamiella sorbophila TaxID=45607 RepID=A0A2T0FE82_9ASCO|nr:Dolichyl pyrophosphate Glc1Man9GlcNAc2 alpha-1,3-glucosyltransferase [Wickerhamiella sorbophila]PRT53277.1 Dolichyl pyrophosphate Glc1Man9GlcNAc2 alpha-1,3-glucosyltransferase [Wickerhamiella sorbophila]